MTRRLHTLALLGVLATACADDVSVGGEDDGTDSTSGTSTTATDDDDGSSGAVEICTPGERVCKPAEVLTCNPEGTAWQSDACDEVCLDGACQRVALEVSTEVLAPATIGFDYAAQLEAIGGTPPYGWSVDGEVPPGLTLDADGSLSGMPTTPGDYVFGATVTDDAESSASRQFSLTVHPEPLTILTQPDLGAFDEGEPMNAPLLAVGGEPPYGWLLVAGDLPEGLIVDASGAVTGTPLQAGTFDFRVRIVDAQEPPGYDEQDFSLDVDLRPLQIVGDQEYDLLAFKVIVLPLMTVVPGVPLPYSTQLTADGGQSPYAWSEEPLPGGLQSIITQAGIPDGLTLDTDGTLSGSVTNTDQVITVPLLLVGIDLTGFFFYAQVADSQDTPETRSALFLIPTLPVGG